MTLERLALAFIFGWFVGMACAASIDPPRLDQCIEAKAKGYVLEQCQPKEK